MQARELGARVIVKLGSGQESLDGPDRDRWRARTVMEQGLHGRAEEGSGDREACMGGAVSGGGHGTHLSSLPTLVFPLAPSLAPNSLDDIPLLFYREWKRRRRRKENRGW